MYLAISCLKTYVITVKMVIYNKTSPNPSKNLKVIEIPKNRFAFFEWSKPQSLELIKH